MEPLTSESELDINHLFGIAGKVCVVTGGGKGIGSYITRGLLINGATVIVISRTITDDIKTSFQAIKKGVVHFISADLTDINTIRIIPQRLLELGISAIDCLINNSGMVWVKDTYDTFSETGWDSVMDLNVKSVFFLTQTLTPLLEKNASIGYPSKVINIGSVAGLVSSPFPTYSYESSKAAMHMLSRKLANDLADRNITVNVLALGHFLTDLSYTFATDCIDKSLFEYVQIPLSRGGKDADIISAVIWILSPAGGFVTGAVIPIDGGMSIDVTPARNGHGKVHRDCIDQANTLTN